MNSINKILRDLDLSKLIPILIVFGAFAYVIFNQMMFLPGLQLIFGSMLVALLVRVFLK